MLLKQEVKFIEVFPCFLPFWNTSINSLNKNSPPGRKLKLREKDPSDSYPHPGPPQVGEGNMNSIYFSHFL